MDRQYCSLSLPQNWIAGFFILIRRPFQRGDQIKVGDIEGTVQAVEIRDDRGMRASIPRMIEAFVSATALSGTFTFLLNRLPGPSLPQPCSSKRPSLFVRAVRATLPTAAIEEHEDGRLGRVARLIDIELLSWLPAIGETVVLLPGPVRFPKIEQVGWR